MRAVWLMVLHVLCLKVAAQSGTILDSCSSAVTGCNTVNSSDVPRPVLSGLNLVCNDTVAAKHGFQEKISDTLEDDVVVTEVQRFNKPSRPSAQVNWITQVISTLEPLPNELGNACKKDTEIYLTELSNFTEWAVRSEYSLFDSFLT